MKWSGFIPFSKILFLVLGSNMLSDESSSDSETGRFKGRTKKQDEQPKKLNQKDDNFRSAGRRPVGNDKFRREFEKRRDERDRYERRSRERQRYSRHSPVRRRYSRERSPYRRSRERDRPRHGGELRPRSKPRENRSSSRDKKRHSRSRSHKSSERPKETKEEPSKKFKEDIKIEIPIEKSIGKFDRKSRDKSSSPEYRGKRSEIYKPTSPQPHKKKSESPIIVAEHGDSDESVEVQPGSYYSMIPAVVKEKSEESSEIDSSDDERLRAKLLNLEKELHKTRKKKHKKKHKRKSSKSSKEREREPSTVEVSSTTDIDKVKDDASTVQPEVAEVSSTQKSNQKESSEEGEISSDDTQDAIPEIDPTDLRHKLKRSVGRVVLSNELESSKPGICGPALPPHLETRYRRSSSHDIEGPALPPHFQKKSKHIGIYYAFNLSTYLFCINTL